MYVGYVGYQGLSNTNRTATEKFHLSQFKFKFVNKQINSTILV